MQDVKEGSIKITYINKKMLTNEKVSPIILIANGKECNYGCKDSFNENGC